MISNPLPILYGPNETHLILLRIHAYRRPPIQSPLSPLVRRSSKSAGGKRPDPFWGYYRLAVVVGVFTAIYLILR